MHAKELMMRPWEDGFDLPETFNMVSLLLERHLGANDGDRIAIIHQGGEMTYRQLGSMTNRIGNGLIKLGIKPGDRVIILLHDRPEFMALFLGAMKIGAVPVPINMLATTGDLEYFLRDSEASAVVMEREIFDKLRTILPEIPHLKALVMFGDPAEGTVDLSQLIESSADQLDTYPTSKNDPSYWLYTSGTTGRPKGVIHWHKDLVYAVETWGRHVVDFNREDRVLCGSKLFFSYGLNNSLYLPLYFGASMILNQERPTPQRILELIAQYRPTGLFSVPTAYGQMLNYLEGSADQPDLSCLRFCISAGEALPGSLFRRWRDRFGIEILDGLGSTEASFIYVSNLPGKVKENSSGLVLPGHTIEVRDEKLSAQAPRRSGRIMGEKQQPVSWLLETAGKDRRDIGGWLDEHRRHGIYGCGGVFLFFGPVQRHHEGQRDLGFSVGSGGCHAQPSGGRRMCRCGGGRRHGVDQAQGLCGAYERVPAGR